MNADMWMVFCVAVFGLFSVFALIRGAMYKNNVRIHYDDAFEDLFSAFLFNEKDGGKIQLKEIKENKFVIVFEENNSCSYDLMLISKYFNVPAKELKNKMVEFSAKEKIIQHSWCKYEKIICFNSKEKIQNFYDNYLLPILVCRKLIGGK